MISDWGWTCADLHYRDRNLIFLFLLQLICLMQIWSPCPSHSSENTTMLSSISRLQAVTSLYTSARICHHDLNLPFQRHVQAMMFPTKSCTTFSSLSTYYSVSSVPFLPLKQLENSPCSCTVVPALMPGCSEHLKAITVIMKMIGIYCFLSPRHHTASSWRHYTSWNLPKNSQRSTDSYLLSKKQAQRSYCFIQSQTDST